MAEKAEPKKFNPVEKFFEGIDTVTLDVDVRGKKMQILAPADVVDATLEAALAFDENKTISGFLKVIGDIQTQQLFDAGCTTRILSEQIVPAWFEATKLGED